MYAYSNSIVIRFAVECCKYKRIQLCCRAMEEPARGADHHLTVGVAGTTSQLRHENLPLTDRPGHCHPLCHKRVSHSSRLFSAGQVLSGATYAHKEVVNVQTPSPDGILAALIISRPVFDLIRLVFLRFPKSISPAIN